MNKIKQSWLGITALVISIIPAFFFIILNTISYLGADGKGAEPDKSVFWVIAFYSLLFIFPLFAIGIGSLSLLRKEPQKIYAVIGLIFAGIQLLPVIIMSVLSLVKNIS